MSAQRATALLVTLLLTSILPVATVAQTALSAAQITERLNEWDQAYARLKREIWNLQRGSSMFGRDLRGRTLSDDLRDFALTAAAEKRIDEQRKLVTSQLVQGNTQLATETIVSMYGNLRDEIEDLRRIGEHRARYRQLGRQRSLWQQRVSTVPNYTAPDTIRDLEQRAVEQLNAGQFEQTRAIYSELLQAYSNERERLRQSGIRLAQTRSESIVYERRSPCGNAAKINTAKAIPSLTSSTHPEYPVTSKSDGEEGTVYVQLLVGSDGCAQRYGIQFSSGWLDLDQASLDWIETLQFIPAAKDGKATDTWVTLPVVFRLN